MSKRIFLPFLLAALVGLSSCSSKLKPFGADYVKVEPQPLEVVGGKVPVTINATFPAKWFNKNATLEVKPVLKYQGGEAWGTMYNFQGEKVAGNGQVIPQKSGAVVTMKSTFDYVPAMQKSELYLTFEAKVGKKTVSLPDLKIGDGVISTSALANAASENPALGADKFQRITKDKYDADIMFVIQQAELRASELKKSELADWKGVVKKADGASNQNVDIEISAYASPDGGYDLNDKLAAQREKNTNQYLSKELKKENVGAAINAKYTAQDWDGFKELVSKSNLQDKDLVLRVLSMYTDPERREKEIKNISAVYSKLADEILPRLRRSRLTANVETIGKSDQEISSLASSNPKALTIEEILYAAALAKTSAEKETIYKKASELFPNDYRTFNNVGMMAFKNGNLSEAEALFNKALQISGGKSPEANCNLGLVALAKGDKTKAAQYFGNAAGADALNNAMGVLSLMNGEYSKAVGQFGNTISNNAALAQLLTKDYNKANATLNAVQNPNATTAYLKAIVAARTNNLTGVVSNLKEAVKKDKSLAAKALDDFEFVKFVTNAEFLNVLR